MARGFSVYLLSGIVALAFVTPALAQAPEKSGSEASNGAAPVPSAPPAYDSYDQPGPSTGNFNTPEADGRPGEYYFQLGVNAYYKHDYAHAIAMYKVAASWAYKPAEFNLGLIYFQGLGVPADKPRGAAWMSLAAERGDRKSQKARDLMLGKLSKSEFAKTFAIWQELKPTYGDEVALARAKARWAQVKAGKTGTRVGDGAEHLLVGGGAQNTASPGGPSAMKGVTTSVGSPQTTSGAQLFTSGQATDGSIAYAQFQRSDNPYDSKFRTDLTGTTSVGALEAVAPQAGKVGDSGKTNAKKDSDKQQLLWCTKDGCS